MTTWECFSCVKSNQCDVPKLVLVICLSCCHLLRRPFISYFVPGRFWSWAKLLQHDKTRQLIHPFFIPLRVWQRKTTPYDVKLTQWLLQVCLIISTLVLAVNKNGWHHLLWSSSCKAITKECHELCSKEHTSILNIKHLAANPVRVTQWAIISTRIKADPMGNIANL